MANLKALAARTQMSLRSTKKIVPPGWRYSSHGDLMLKLIPHVALEEFIHGRGGLVDWQTLSFRLHLGAELAARHAPDAREGMLRAMTALFESRARFLQTGRWDLAQAEAHELGDGLNYSDQLQDLCTRLMQKAACAAVVRANMKDLERIGLASREHALLLIK